MVESAKRDFDGTCKAYLEELSRLLSEPRRWIRWPAVDMSTRLARGDPDFRKLLDELHDRITALVRIKTGSRPRTGARTPEFDDARQARIVELLRVMPGRLDLQGARDLLYSLELELIDVADEATLFGWVKRERYWKKGMTSWLTWDRFFADDQPDVPVIRPYFAGKPVEDAALDSARKRLRTLIDARHNDDLVRRTRRQLRAQNLVRLAMVVFLILGVILIIEWSVAQPPVDMGTLLLAPFAGAFGATIAGTVKARRLATSWDFRTFREGLVAQVAVGAAFAAIVVLIFQAGLITIGQLDPDTVSGQLILGFLAGFSEPFSIGTVESVIGLAAPKSTSEEAEGGDSQ
jgi:hypothetical protein